MTTKLGELKAKLGEYESTIRDHTSAISSAKSKCDEWTRSDVGKIQRESMFCPFSFPFSSFLRTLLDPKRMYMRLSHWEETTSKRKRLTHRRVRNPARSPSMEDPIPTRRSTRDALRLGSQAHFQLLSLRTRPRDRFYLLPVLQRRRRRGYRRVVGAGQGQPGLDVEVEIENNSCSSTSHPLGVEDEANNNRWSRKSDHSGTQSKDSVKNSNSFLPNTLLLILWYLENLQR
jgi:hypothetical protein